MFDEREMITVVRNLAELREKLPGAIKKCLDYFPDIDRSVTGYEGLMAAQEHLPNDEIKDKFATDFSYLSRLWEALSPDACLEEYKDAYRWLSQVYVSVKPTSGRGKLIWHVLGAKTLDIMNEHAHLAAIHDDLEISILDENTLKGMMEAQYPKKIKEIEFKITHRLQKHLNNPKFVGLGEKLEKIKEEYEKGFFSSLEFLKRLLSLAKEVLEAEKEVEPEDERKIAKAALTDLFNQVKTDKTPIIVERVVNDIDGEIVKAIRFPEWKQSISMEREIQKTLRQTLKKYNLHLDQELFRKAYAYIKQYY
jgi:type I restriction enzyme R subunit